MNGKCFILIGKHDGRKGAIDLVYELESCCLQWQAVKEVQAVNAGPARYDSREAPWSAGDGSAEPGAYRPGYELVAEQILRLIGELALAPGDRMPAEQNLAARLGASRTIVREAVKILSPSVASARRRAGVCTSLREAVRPADECRHPSRAGPRPAQGII